MKWKINIEGFKYNFWFLLQICLIGQMNGIPQSDTSGKVQSKLNYWENYTLKEEKNDFKSSAELNTTEEYECDNVIERANEVFIQGKLNEAKNYLSKCLETHPDNYEARFSLATILFNEGKFKQAEEQFIICNKLDTTSVELYEYLGQISVATTNIPGIKYYYEKVLKLDSLNIDALNILGTIYLQDNNIGLARKLFEKVIDHYPSDSYGHLNLGILYGLINDLPQAELHLMEAAKIDSLNKSIFSSLGLFYLNNGYFNNAEITLERAITIDSSDFDSRLGLLIALQNQNKFEKAISQGTVLISIKPDDPQPYLILSNIYRMMKEYDKALVFVYKAIDIDSTNNDAYQLLNDIRFQK